MLRRWLCYLVAWTGCLIFFVCYREWFSWLSLVAVTAFPLFSLLLSLPAMLTATVTPSFPSAVTVGTPVEIRLQVHSPLPLPVWKAKLSVGRELTASSWILKPGACLPTDHCGSLECSLFRCQVYDYLGLFPRRIKCRERFTVSVRPAPILPDQLSALHPAKAIRWKAKRGGGFAESYELRLYRPGDNVQQIHWKLTGKTGKLMLREPMEPADLPTLALHLCGSPEELDRKLGQLLWMGQELTEQSISFRILAQTGEGVFRRTVTCQSSLWDAMDALLAQRPGDPGQLLLRSERYHYIGGIAHEKA